MYSSSESKQTRLTGSLENLSINNLLNLYISIMDELMARKVLRTQNNPAGDYALWLLCSALNLEPRNNSNKGFDAVDCQGIRYEIKARRLMYPEDSRQLSAIRAIENKSFDFLLAVLFNRDFSILSAHRIPYLVVVKHAKYIKHVNGYRLILNDNLIREEGVETIHELMSSSDKIRMKPAALR